MKQITKHFDTSGFSKAKTEYIIPETSSKSMQNLPETQWLEDEISGSEEISFGVDASKHHRFFAYLWPCHDWYWVLQQTAWRRMQKKRVSSTWTNSTFWSQQWCKRGKHVENTHHHTFNVYISNCGVCPGVYYVLCTPSSWKRGFSTWCIKSSHLRRICRKIRCGSPPRSHSDSQPDQETISLSGLSARKSWKKSFSSWCLRAVRNHSPGLCKDLHRLIPITDLFLHTTPDPLSWKVHWPGNSGMRKKTFVLWGWYNINYRMIWYWHISCQIHIRWFIWWYVIELLMLYNVQMIFTHVIDGRLIGLYSRYHW